MKTTRLLIALVALVTTAILCFTPGIAGRILQQASGNAGTKQNSAFGQAAPQATNGKIYFDTDRDGHAQIYSMDPDGSNQTRLTNDSSIDADPVWSAVDQKVAFVSNRNGRFQIYTMNADGSGQRRIGDGTGNDVSPAWSPYGHILAFASDRTGNFDIYQMDFDGANLGRVTFTSSTNINPAWAPDGARLAFQSNRNGNFQIYTTDYTSSTRLTNNAFDDQFPLWSPDGAKIAFASTRDGNQEIYSMNVDGTNQTRLTNNPASDGLPAWSPDGTTIVFESNRNGNFQLYRMHADGSSQTRLTNNSATDENPNWGAAFAPPAFWTYTDSMKTARQMHTATLLTSGKVLIVGGLGQQPLSSCEIYDPVSGTWSSTGSLNVSRYGHAAVLLNDGKVLVAGGKGAETSAEVYDPTSGAWTATGSLNTSQSNPAGVLLNTGKFLVAGNAGAELYDPTTGTWSVTGSPRTTISSQPGVQTFFSRATRLLNGNVLLVGSLGAAELYDTASGTWTLTGSLNPNWDHAYPAVLSLLMTGDVLGVGGQSSPPGDNELYNSALGTWTTVSPNCCARRQYGHTATLLNNGEVLIAGGEGTSFATTSVDIYDPRSATMTSGPAFGPRTYHTATLLLDGRLLVVGGTVALGAGAMPSAEIFTAYDIAGRITKGQNGVQGVQVTLSGQMSSSTTTDANGNYSFLNLEPNGSYTVTPSSSSFTFSPSSQSFSNLIANQSSADFGATPTATATPTPTPAGGIVQFFSPEFDVFESAGAAIVTVTRSGDTSTAAAVNYTTSDGTATQKSDYIFAAGTLAFAAGEASKSFQVLIVLDAYQEGNETLRVSLSNPVGAALGVQSTATVVIFNTDFSPPNTNPNDNAQFFVREHYSDFLNRLPDTPGLDFWTNQITSCGSDLTCTALKRVNVSAAFFLSTEFQQTGYLVERMYKAAYADSIGSSTFGGSRQLSVPIVRYTEFLTDTQQIGQGVVVGQTGWAQVLENNKQNFASQFVQRSRFTDAFPTALTPAQFVDRLFVNAGVAPTSAERDAAITEFGSATNTMDVAARGRALRDVPENATLNSQEFNRAFVLMQYFGYLRRNPNDAPDSDYSGYDFWLSKLNQFNGNYVSAEMVKAFIASDEYRRRFGP